MEVTFSHENVTLFRRGLLLLSGVFSAISLLILSQDPKFNCPGSELRLALWLAFSIQISAFFLLLLHFIYLGFILRKLGKLLGLYYFYVVGAMIAVQIVFFQGGSPSVAPDGTLVPPINCFKHSPGMYSWLVLQIVVFYALVAYGIAMCGAYLCWEADVEEKKIKKAVRDYLKFKEAEQQRAVSQGQRMLMLDDDKTEPLLQQIKSISPQRSLRSTEDKKIVIINQTESDNDNSDEEKKSQ